MKAYVKPYHVSYTVTNVKSCCPDFQYMLNHNLIEFDENENVFTFHYMTGGGSDIDSLNVTNVVKYCPFCGEKVEIIGGDTHS